MAHLEREVSLAGQATRLVAVRIVHGDLALRLLHVHDTQRREQECQRVDRQIRVVLTCRLHMTQKPAAAQTPNALVPG